MFVAALLTQFNWGYFTKLIRPTKLLVQSERIPDALQSDYVQRKSRCLEDEIDASYKLDSIKLDGSREYTVGADAKL